MICGVDADFTPVQHLTKVKAKTLKRELNKISCFTCIAEEEEEEEEEEGRGEGGFLHKKNLLVLIGWSHSSALA